MSLFDFFKKKKKDESKRIIDVVSPELEKTKKIKLLPYEDLKKALDEKGIEYDEWDVRKAYFPLKDVEVCLDTEKSAKVAAETNHRSCPLCGKPSEELKWIYFDSPGWTWQKLCGRAGPMSICPDCGCLVEFICILMN